MAKGGKRPGAGRRKGSKDAKSLEKDAILRAYRQRVMGYANDLLNTQMTLARGTTYLYKIEKEVFKNKKGEITKVQRKKPELVTAQWEIEDYLHNRLETGELDDPEATYYFLTSKDPDGNVIKDMLDRTFGRPTQSVVTEDPEGNQQPIMAINIIPVNSPSQERRYPR